MPKVNVTWFYFFCFPIFWFYLHSYLIKILIYTNTILDTLRIEPWSRNSHTTLIVIIYPSIWAKYWIINSKFFFTKSWVLVKMNVFYLSLHFFMWRRKYWYHSWKLLRMIHRAEQGKDLYFFFNQNGSRRELCLVWPLFDLKKI